MEFKTDQGKTFTSNFDNDATEFIMKSRTEDSNSGKIIPFPFMLRITLYSKEFIAQNML